MELTVGIILAENNKMLLVHPTGANFWNIPKGIQEDGETDWVTAKRELHEETNINLADYNYSIIKESAFYKYKKRSKYAKAFLVILNEKIKRELKCNTFFDNFDKGNIIATHD